MKKKQSLQRTNPYLRKAGARRKAFVETVISSSAVEGITLTRKDLK